MTDDRFSVIIIGLVIIVPTFVLNTIPLIFTRPGTFWFRLAEKVQYVLLVIGLAGVVWMLTW